MENNYIDKKYGLYIGGEWRPAENDAVFTTYNPSNGQPLAECAAASDSDVDAAVRSAWKAFPDWKATSTAQRAAILQEIASVIDANKEKLATIETLDNGKPIRESKYVDVPAGADHFRYFASAIRVKEGSAVMLDDKDMSIILREPLGAVGQIIPWNFPFLMASWKIAPALAAGNCVVIKSSSSTPLSLLELAKLIGKLLPPGVLNVLTGHGATTGNALLNHPGIVKLAFTGSTDVGYSVAEAAAKKIIPATLELGGKSANIFFADAEWQKALDGMAMGILFNQGQMCSAGSRVFVQDEIYDRFLAASAEAFKKIKVGLPWEPSTMMGAIVSEKQLERVLKYVKIGQDEGATLAVGGKRIETPSLKNGYFMEPTILANVTNDMRVAREEIFGPVAVFIRFKDEEDVIRQANDNDYGLAGAVWTNDINRAFKVARGVHTGRMWVNSYNLMPAGAPFGGYKKSGIGRETHRMILDSYSQVKNIFVSFDEKPSGFYPV